MQKTLTLLETPDRFPLWISGTTEFATRLPRLVAALRSEEPALSVIERIERERERERGL
jgi:hypothetical protein